MVNPKLEKAPLIETVFGLHWDLDIFNPYEVLYGKLYEKIQEKYPDVEKIDNPLNKLSGGHITIQHNRFKQSKEREWPVIQLRPGVISLHNARDSYKWESFRDNLSEMVNFLFASCPDIDEKLKINILRLTYLDALKFNFETENIVEFLKEKIKIDINVKDNFFGENIDLIPVGIDFHLSFRSIDPKGIVSLVFRRGRIKNEIEDCLMWETGLIFIDKDGEYKTIDRILEWADSAHNLLVNSFLKVTKEGSLEERFI